VRVEVADNYGRRRLVNNVMIGVMMAAAVIAILPLFALFVYVVGRGIGAINLAFFTQLPQPAGEPGGGLANAIVGSLIIIAIASAIAVPIGVLGGVYLAEYGEGSRLDDLIRFFADVLTGLPSIVVGLFVYGMLVLTMGRFSALAGGVSLGVIMIPLLARTTEEVVRLVPNAVREAALGLGVPQWRTILRVVVPTAMSGIITGVMLGISRIAGETAPLLFTALGNQFWNLRIDRPMASLPVQIYTFGTGAYENQHRQAWAGALVLVTIVLLLNIGARSLARSRSGIRR
jgi:phosphate transport system permease protein